ncbi:J domain-containing protein [Sphingomonas lacunae]|uniref:J domain-containing protein n=1 Tax=Sphingomonas lacunae TaxID=2698828 RepID=A0A6M4AWZ5_9SPHN|nr:J domain-containing protein [Sphingomonas lacunae]QJQ31481.1 J domain-containing protein [Sphingomonas lacunae]
MAVDPYTLLGVPRSASEADIKKAYRKLAKELHPDANKDNPKAAARFSEVTQAYDILGDAEKRARFDRGEIDADGNPANPFAGAGAGFGAGGFGAQGFRGSGPWGQQRGGFAPEGDPSSIFEELFGGRSRRAPPPRGANINYRLSVGFADAATLAPQRITLGDGKTIDLKLPKGVETGTQMRLPGRGEPGPGGSGDAIVTIEIKPHAFFRRDGADVRLDLPVSLAEAVKGAKVKVPTVDGPVMLGIPPGSTSGKVLRLKGKGFSRKDGTRGDQLVSLLVDVPADDAALAAFVESWDDGRNIRAALGV